MTKKSDQKTSKKTVDKVLPFTKARAIQFANRIFNETDGSVSYTKLCDSTLKSGKLHCAIGEAYYTFVNTSLKNVLRSAPHSDSEYAESQGGSTGAAIDALVKLAKIKPGVSKERLGEALADVVSDNDSAYDFGQNDSETQLKRSQTVAKTWLKRVVPLLK